MASHSKKGFGPIDPDKPEEPESPIDPEDEDEPPVGEPSEEDRRPGRNVEAPHRLNTGLIGKERST